MNGFLYNLPPQVNVEEVTSEYKDLQGYLEVEVSRLNFITSTKNKTTTSGKVPVEEKNAIVCSEKQQQQTFKEGTPLHSVIINNKYKNKTNNNLSGVNEISQKITTKLQTDIEGNYCNRYSPFECKLQVKFVWWGEHKEDAANINISCKTQPTPLPSQQKRQFKQHLKSYQPHYQQQLQQRQQQPPQSQQEQTKHKQHKRQHLLLSANNIVRYRICTKGALFLEYLHTCKPIEIIVTSISLNSTGSCAITNQPLGQAQFNLPLVFLKKFQHNIVKGHNFEYKTKVFTLYQQQQPTTKQELVLNNRKKLIKSGEIQLRFKMLFAPTVANSVTAVAAAAHQANVVMHDKHHHLHNNNCHHHHHHHHHRHHHHHLGGKNNKVPTTEDVQGDIPKRLTSQTKSEEIVEAMKKLDAKLVAYLAGETEIATKHVNTHCEEENEVNLNLENHNNNNNNNNMTHNLEDLLPATKLNIFKSISSIKLEMEALTLQAEGTKCINLMQNEIEPIFTVECQLSNELIKQVERHEMFHIMQFESQKFQSLTQCTRFGQKAERAVKLELNEEQLSDENANETELEFGCIHFTVWWREPGTCLNEMLGMGVLELKDLYKASLLEQCKRIEIQRRGKHLACLYFKITLQRDNLKFASSNAFLSQQLTTTDSDSEKTQNTDKQKSTTTATNQQQTAQCSSSISSISSSVSGVNGSDKESAQNNNVKFETTNFDDETSKIRLLKGFISANETRNLDINHTTKQTFLICRRFWLDEPATAKADDTSKFNYQEQFSVINDEKFLQRVEKQYLHLELWQRKSCDDGNGNLQDKAQPLGMVRMPLHQFFIAYRDAAITNHLCKGKLPVISIDNWAPIVNCQTGLNVGEMKCLLAVGSDEQIKYLKKTRGLMTLSTSPTWSSLTEDKHFIYKLQPLQIPTSSKTTTPFNSSASQLDKPAKVASSPSLTSDKIKKTSDLLDMLQKVLMTPTSTATDCQPVRAQPLPSTAPLETKSSSSLASPLKPSNVKLFKFSLDIQKALGLPLNPASKAKKGYSKRNASKRFPPNEAPSCYVTFQADEGQYPLYKSHEGMVYATNIVEKSTQPQWQQRFRLAVSIDYLKIPQKLFILKVLKKSSLDITQGRNLPTPMEDAIVGLTAVDLSAFVRGLHIAGTFNIVDFNGRINGQLMIRCQPLEEIPANLFAAINTKAAAGGVANNVALPAAVTASTVDSVIDEFEQTLDLEHLNLGQAIKRKFTELEGISQRLRARLGDVTGTELTKEFDLKILDEWQPMENEEAKNEFEEFENDLNTPPSLLLEEKVEDKQQLEEEKKEIKTTIQKADEQKLKDNNYLEGKGESVNKQKSE